MNTCKYLLHMKDIFIFTDCDLDGAGSYLTFKWFTGKDIPYKVTRVADFRDCFSVWYNKNGNLYDQIYILDLDVSDYIDIVDKKNVTIIDHHKTHVDKKHLYKNANCIIKKYTSCTKLIYKTLSQLLPKASLTDAQKLIILYIDDYDSYQLKHDSSYCLNLLFWNYQGNRLNKFMDNFGNGFNGFSDNEKKIIKFYKNKLQHIIQNLNVHVASNVPIFGAKCKLVSVFADECINEVADHIIKNYKSDIGFVVNLTSNHVSIRRSSKCDVDLGKLAQKIIKGGGHEDAAGGIITKDFLSFSKIFSPMKIKIGS